MGASIDKLKKGFTPTFWIANTLELFERFAFYGSKAVLTVYLATKLGLEQDAGTLAGTFSFILYSMPILAGVFVDRYGFRRTLMTCFAMFTIGYFAIGFAGFAAAQGIVGALGTRTYVLIALIWTAIGGSLIKPCIVGTVAKTSSEDVKSLGFSIYYTLVNVGGAVGPILAMTVREGFGIEFVLVGSSITSFLLFLGTLFFFKEPRDHGKEHEDPAAKRNEKTLGRVFRDMLQVFRNFRFISFLVIFSGFWLMFWQIFYSYPFYVTEILKFARFELLETVDAWTIILISVPITALVKKWKPMTAMTMGFLIASCSWIVIAMSPTVTAAIVGTALFALGEATQAPRFYEYVASLAPKSQVGTFMGFAFLPVAIGSLLAGTVADWLRHSYLGEAPNPQMMFLVLAGMGFVSTALMVLHAVVFRNQTEVEA